MNVHRPFLIILIAGLMISSNLAFGAVTLSNWDDPAVGGPNEPLTGAPAPCDTKSKVVYHNVTALPLPIVYNNWGDIDPQGRVYVLNDDVLAVLTDTIQTLQGARVDVQTQPAMFTRVIAELQAAKDALYPVTPGQVPNVPDAVGALARLERAFFQDQHDMNKTFAQIGATAMSNLTPVARVQPLTLRAHVGECLRITLLNLLPEPAGIHVHDVVTRPGQGMSLGDNDVDFVLPGLTREYVAYIPKADNMEGAHLFHSHADSRYQTRHGLFGVIVAEPANAMWIDNDGSGTGLTGDQAIINMPGSQRDFREHVLIYHDEVDLYGWVQIAANGSLTLTAKPTISPYGEYGPGSKAINLRSEPFMNRLAYHENLNKTGVLQTEYDKSQAYGSYTYGDPGVSIPRSYVGDPTKFRLVNAGPGQPHVHHLHGGGIRWRMSPVADDPQFSWGLTKTGNIQLAPSDRLDVQNIGVGESYNAVPEGGAGGVQQAVGDFLFHCHIVEHYVAGMWSFWRVYNTLQPGVLGQLPDRVANGDVIPMAVNSTALRNEDYNGTTLATDQDIIDWVKPQLPAQGVPVGYDASVWNYEIKSTEWGPLFLGEPESNLSFPNYLTPGVGRPEILFNPDNGRISFPLFKPHLGQRPPFAPDHGPAPYLGKYVEPGIREDGLCIEESEHRNYNIVATHATIGFTGNSEDVDEKGMVFAHATDWHAVYNGDKNPKSMILRANAGDCVDVLFRSDMKEATSKTNMHIHLVQFDVQASDGVISGFNYEQSVRPARQSGTKLDGGSDGTDTLKVDSVVGIHVGAEIGLGLNLVEPLFRKVTAIDAATRTLTLNASVPTGALSDDDWVGYEYVRYRWYPDVELGMVYWHDHVDGIKTWMHGLFGGLVVEPANTKWCTPTRTNETQLNCTNDVSGHVVDIIKSDDLGSSYREIVLQVQDRACASPEVTACTAGSQVPNPPDPIEEPATINLRSAPFIRRNAEYPLTSWATVDGQAQGDPATDILRAYPKDKVVIRLLYAGQSMTAGVGTFAVTGHRFQAERNLPNSRVVDSLSFGISSQHNIELLGGAGGGHGLPGDYLYGMTNPDLMTRGAWGLLRVHDTVETSEVRLQPLPLKDNTPGVLPAGNGDPERITVYVRDANVQYSTDSFETDHNSMTPELPYPVSRGTVYFSHTDSSTPRPDPFVHRVHSGKRIEVTVFNHQTNTGAPNQRVTFHSTLLSADPRLEGGIGIPVGNNDIGDTKTTVPLGGSRTFTFYADEYEPGGLGATHVTSFGAIGGSEDTANRGLFGSIIVEPATSTFSPAEGPMSNVTWNGKTWREFALLYRTQDGQFETSTMQYLVDLKLLSEVNYRIEPLHERVGGIYRGPEFDEWIGGMNIHTCKIDKENCGDRAGFRLDIRNPLNPLAFSIEEAETPVISVKRLDPLIIRAVNGYGDQQLTHHLQGHRWALDPAMNDCKNDLTTCRSNVISVATLGHREASNAWIPEAGPAGTGDYLVGMHRDAMVEGGMWGMLRVCSTLLPSGLCDLSDLTLLPSVNVPKASEAFNAADLEARQDMNAFHKKHYLDPAVPSASDCETVTGAVEIPPFAFFAFSTSTVFYPGFIPLCVNVASGGSVLWRNDDVFSDHDPASTKDAGTGDDNAATRCFASRYHRPVEMGPADEFRVYFRYQEDLLGVMKLEAGQSEVGPWRDCTQEVDASQTTPTVAVLPYQCDIHPNMVGTIVVAKTGTTPPSSVTGPLPGEPSWRVQ